MSWSEYYEKMKGRPVRPLLIKALQEVSVDAPKTALDLGCGIGTDSLHLLSLGWKVLAIDKESEGIEALLFQMPTEWESRLTHRRTAFENLDELPQTTLIYASLSLPFCRPDSFLRLWATIESSFHEQSVFAAHFFGPEDDWVVQNQCVGHSEEDIRALLKNFKKIDLHVVREVGPTAAGGPKHWHLLTVVASNANLAEA